MINSRNIEILDCTFRDGGYYNNWNFNNDIIQDYINNLSQLNIKFIEIGFRSTENFSKKGETGFSKNSFINRLKIPENCSIGVMINSSELINKKKQPLQNCKKILGDKIAKKIKFVRFACHYHEIFHLKKTIKWLNKKNIKVFINVMQISEISKKNISEICHYLESTKIECIYLADSLGSLNPKKIIRLIKTFKIFWKHDLGFHAHNNLGLALKNAITANENGVKWIDCTLMGMGRGPGNLLTEDLIKFIKNPSAKFFIKKKIMDYFANLKKIYKWGPNKYYAIAAKYKIHPTYVQRMLSDHRYNKSNYDNIVNSLKKTKASKYNPIKYFQYSFFSNSNKYKNNKLPKFIDFKKILIVGPGSTVKKHKNRIKKFIKQNNVLVLALNTVDSLSENLIDLRVACHPLRMISDVSIYKKKKFKNLVLPFYSLNNNIRNLIKTYNVSFYNYALKLTNDKKIMAKNNFCLLPYPLAIGYALSIASTRNTNNIYLAGLDGFDLNDPENDDTNFIIDYFSKKILKKKFITLTKSKYNNLVKI